MMPMHGAWHPKPYGLAVVVLVALGMAGLIDPAVANAAAHAPRGIMDLGKLASFIGLSGYMLVISAAIVFGAPLLTKQGDPTRLFGFPMSALRERAAFFFVVIAVSGLLCQAMKHIVGRARPRMLHELGAYHFDLFTVRAGMESFPSGHTTTIFAAAFVLGRLLPRWRPGFYAIAVVVGTARVMAVNHFPSDVVAGAVLGTITAAWMMKVFAERNIVFSIRDRGIGLKPIDGRAAGALS